MQEALALALTKEAGIVLATTAEGMVTLPDSKLLRQIRNTYHPQRSGDIYVVQAPYWFNFDRGPVTAMHGSPWSYDTHVPVIFAGGRIPAQKLHRLIQPADVAPTLAALLGMTPDIALAVSLATRIRELVVDIPGLLVWQHFESKLLLNKRNTIS